MFPWQRKALSKETLDPTEPGEAGELTLGLQGGLTALSLLRSQNSLQLSPPPSATGSRG